MLHEFLFPKQDQANISDDQLLRLRKIAKGYAALTPDQVEQFRQQKFWTEYAMPLKRNDKSDLDEAIHSSASEPRQIRKLRLRNHVSQPVFARYLNTSESTIEKWESGAKKPSGIALKMLAVIEKHGLQILA